MKAEKMFGLLNEQIKSQTSFIALVGSHNYNLADEKSDYDFKLFIYPTFLDLYNGAKKNGYDVKIHDCDLKTTDIRKFKDCLVKSSINFVETLYSDDIFIPTTESEELDKANKEMINFLIHNREALAAMNIKYLIKVCRGTIQARRNGFTNNGNYKAAAEAFKTAVILKRYLDNRMNHDDNSFLNAIKFSKEDSFRGPYFQIRNKSITDNKILRLIDMVTKNMETAIEKGGFDFLEKDHIMANALDMVLKKAVTKRVQIELNNKYKK